jgi:hypothetical protein
MRCFQPSSPRGCIVEGGCSLTPLATLTYLIRVEFPMVTSTRRFPASVPLCIHGGAPADPCGRPGRVVTSFTRTRSLCFLCGLVWRSVCSGDARLNSIRMETGRRHQPTVSSGKSPANYGWFSSSSQANPSATGGMSHGDSGMGLDAWPKHRPSLPALAFVCSWGILQSILCRILRVYRYPYLHLLRDRHPYCSSFAAGDAEVA